MTSKHAGWRTAPHRYLLAAGVAMACALPAQADAVTDWNAVAGSPQVLPRFGGPQFQYRAMAVVQIAVHDALNMIQPRYETYGNLPAAAAGASPMPRSRRRRGSPCSG